MNIYKISRLLELRRALMIVIGAIISAVGILIFLAPFDVAPGGVTGVAVILNHLDPRLPIGLMVILGNIPIQALGYKYLGGWRVVFRTVFYILIYAVLIDVLTPFVKGVDVGHNVLLTALFGGVLEGIGGGLVYLAGGTQGGTSTLGRILQNQWGIPMSSSAMYTDSLVVLLAGWVFGWEGALYAIVALFVSGAVADYVLEGPSTVRTATIITDKPTQVAEAVLQQMGRGVTAWEGRGMFTQQAHSVLFITISRPQVSDLQRLVQQVDASAFIVIGQGHIAYGEGFQRVKSRF